MKQIKIADATLCREGSSFNFKEKIEIARQLERLNVDVIEMPAIQNPRIDTLLIRTISTFVKRSVLSVSAGMTLESVESAAAAVANATHPRIRIELPLSPVGMEYTCHKKPDKMLAWIEKTVAAAKEKCADVEFCAMDATRAEEAFLIRAIDTAVQAGANVITLSDSAANLFPNDFAAFFKRISEHCQMPVLVRLSNQNSMAMASAVMAIGEGAEGIKTTVGDETVSLECFAAMVKNCGESYGLSTAVRYTELHRIVKQITRILENAKGEKPAHLPSGSETEIYLDENDDREAVIDAVAGLGYDLSYEDQTRVYEEFLHLAAKKRIGAKDLEAIVASVALQVSPTYVLKSYVVNNGNIISSTAQVTLEKDGALTSGVCIGDGPIDAAFLAIEQIIGHRYELDDFQIQSVTEGKEAMGSALVKLRADGKLYSGNGISTDIIGAAIRAYLNAVNKIVYEEANV